METKNDSNDSLKIFGQNLTKEAKENNIDPIIGRDDEIRRIIRILSRKTKNNPVLVGEPGVGKTAIVEGLAKRIVSGHVPENLKNKEIYEIQVGNVIAGASFQGEFEKRIKSLLEQVEKSNGQIILFIDEIHTLIGAGRMGGGGLDAAQMLKPLLARGKIRLIGATTLNEYRQYVETDAALERRMQKILVDEPSETEAITILRGIKERFETFHGVKIHDNALVEAVKLATRYISDRYLPDKAIDLIDEAAAGIQTEMNSKPEAIEKIEQKISILKMEEAALKNEEDLKSQNRLTEVEKEIAKEQESLDKLSEKWNKEISKVQKVSDLKKRIEIQRNYLVTYQNNGEYEKASKILYHELPLLETQLKEAENVIKNDVNSLVSGDVTEDEIAKVVSRWTGIPIDKLLESQRDKLLNLQDHLEQRVIGQSEATQKVTDAILRARANINDPNRPIGSFIFMGPTGVGKTEVAKTLAYELFDSDKHLIRIDMSEYGAEHNVARLIGSPPGYIGYEQGGQLTEAVRQKPYSIILFDEIEKAHPKVLDVLLQILDDGILTDGKGKTINFKNTIIVMTTNIGSQLISENKPSQEIENELKKYLRPEFLNRVDEIIKFNSLELPVIIKITDLELKKLTQRLEEKDYFLTFSPECVKQVAQEAFDPLFGARPIKRYIQKYIESKLAKDIISTNFKTDIHYHCEYKNDEYAFEPKNVN